MLVEAGSRNNIIDYTTWTAGTSGSESGFSRNGSNSENYRVIDDGPQGNDIVVWEARPDSSSGADGGWNGDYFSIDNTKLYRFSVWIRRTVIGSGTAYLGTNGGGSNVLSRSSGSANSNPYFWIGGWGYPAGEWVLLVGHVWPVGSGTGSDHPDSGRYTVEDGRVANISRDFVCASGTTSLRLRTYLYYSTNTSTRQQFCYPRVDVCDGTEPSISDMLHGLDERWEASGFPDGLSVQNNSTVSGRVSELGITDGMVAYYPLRTDTKDYSGNGYDGSASGATPVGGGFDGNGAYSFDGSGTADGATAGDHIDIPSGVTTTSTANYPNGCTYSFWINVDEDAVDRMSLFYGGTTIRHIEIFSSSKYFRTESATQNGYSFGSSNFPDEIRGRWSHFTIVFANAENGRPVRWYQNGSLFHTGDMTSGSNPDGEYFNFSKIGRATGNTSYTYAKSFNGFFCNLKIFNRALAHEEIAVEYKRSGPTKMAQYNGGIYLQGQLKEVIA